MYNNNHTIEMMSSCCENHHIRQSKQEEPKLNLNVLIEIDQPRSSDFSTKLH